VAIIVIGNYAAIQVLIFKRAIHRRSRLNNVS
jgi:hypothetical protein